MAFDILMYHSISEAGGPTSIEPSVFEGQMAALEASGRAVVSLDAVAEASNGGATLPDGAIALTFDDGFEDFAEVAWPCIARRRWPVTVFLPTDRMGGIEDWEGALVPPRSIMSWDRATALFRDGVSFGGHSLRHPDLTALDDVALAAEIEGPKAALETRFGEAPRHFAPPYGRSDRRVRAQIARHWATSCGTRLDRARPSDDIFDLPRLEMFYYTRPESWRRHLAGQGGPYLRLRQALRTTRLALRRAGLTA